MGKIKTLLFVWIFIAGFVGATVTPPPAGASPSRVLLISSYHPGFPTFFQQTNGIKSIFSQHGILLDVEFMDKKRFADAENEAHFLESLSYKLKKTLPYDAIMTADDDAFLFLLQHKATLFPAQPAIFFGVNNIAKAKEQDSRADITGVIEAVSMKDTVQMMLDLLPGTQTILALVDSTPSSLGDAQTFRQLAATFPEVKFSTLSLNDRSFTEFTGELQKIDNKTAVLLLSAYVDRDEKRISFEDSLTLILNNLRQPLFHLWYHGMGSGILGGKVISHEQQGKTAAELVVRILGGEPVEHIKVIDESPNITIVDYNVLKRFRLEKKRLPEDTVILNKPFSLYGQYKLQILLGALFFLLQTVFIAFLGYVIRKKKITEAALRESENRYSGFFKNNHSVILIVHPKTGRIVDSNPAACAFYGYTREAMIGKEISSINRLPPLEIQAEMEAARSQQRNHFFFQHHLASGEIRDVEVYSGPIMVNGEQLLCSIIHDITERRRAEQAVRERELFLAAILQTAAEGFWMLDTAGYLVEVNNAYCVMTGFSREELIGMHIGALDAGVSADQLQVRTSRVIAKGWEIYETSHRKKDGTLLPVEVSCTHLDEREGQFVHFCRDLTERKNAEKQLRTTLERTQIILSNIQLGLLLINKDDKVEFINQACCNLFGIAEQPQALLGLDAAAMRHKVAPSFAEPETTLVRLQEILAQNKPVKDEQVGIADGRMFLCDFVPLVIDGKQYGRLWYSYDISERRRAEEERKHLQEQLVQAQKMEAIGTLAGGIAHDFNNILSAVLGYAEMAKDASDPESKVCRHLGMVIESAQRAAGLVKQILAFSRQGETKRLRLEPARMVKEAVKLLRSTIPSTIEINMQIDRRPMFIVADPIQLHQVVMNLCTNAYHAMEETGGTIAIELKPCELSDQDIASNPQVKAGQFVRLTVADTGPGIPFAIKDKIFEPYFTTKEIGKGTGLGLSIVHGIVSTVGGFITYEGEPGEGATFQVYFPAAHGEMIPEPASGAVALAGKEHVLYVDDEVILAEMGQVMLERLGYRVTVRTSSLEALITFQNAPDDFDVVITDQTMPGMTGVDLARRMLQIRPHLPVILCTGFSSLVNEEQAQSYGIRGFVMKPMTQKEIALLLRKIMEEQKVRIN